MRISEPYCAISDTKPLNYHRSLFLFSVFSNFSPCCWYTMPRLSWHEASHCMHKTVEPHHEKTGFLHMRKTKPQISCAVTAQLISAFVLATQQLVKSLFPLYFQNLKLLACFCDCTGLFVSDLVRNPKDWVSLVAAQFIQSLMIPR